ncbi:hypothetical protein CR513_24052, partial [Mucuna pruriens]
MKFVKNDVVRVRLHGNKIVATKVIQITKHVIDKDSNRQYSLLWSFSVELRRTCAENTCKIQLDIPTQNLEPIFDRYYMCLYGYRKTFKAICRPFIKVDVRHMKNKYNRQLLFVSTRTFMTFIYCFFFAIIKPKSKDP